MVREMIIKQSPEWLAYQLPMQITDRLLTNTGEHDASSSWRAAIKNIARDENPFNIKEFYPKPVSAATTHALWSN